jgi:hypothetical protein
MERRPAAESYRRSMSGIVCRDMIMLGRPNSATFEEESECELS